MEELLKRQLINEPDDILKVAIILYSIGYKNYDLLKCFVVNCRICQTGE